MVEECRLSEDQINSFVEKGFLSLPKCFSRDVATLMVERTFRPQGCFADIRGTRGIRSPPPPGSCDLNDTSAWIGERFDCESGHRVLISEHSPKLWSALIQLVGGEDKIATKHLGVNWILNTSKPTSFNRMPAETGNKPGKATRGEFWHIDTVSQNTVLTGRFDALSLLVLWSDVEPQGGRTLYSPDGTTCFLRRLNESGEEADARRTDWFSRIMHENVDGVHEQTGQAGDVIILHSLSLHSRNTNFKRKVRILENLGINLTAPLNYSDANLNPSPVERCISTKLGNYTNLHKQVCAYHRWEQELSSRIDYLILEHPSYFLPSLERWLSETNDSLQQYVYGLDSEIMKGWTSFHCNRIRNRHRGAESAVRGACSLVRHRMISQRVFHAHLKDDYVQREGFFTTGLSRGLRGFGNCEGINDLLWRLLKELFPRAELYDLRDSETGLSHHIVVKVITEEGWCIADAWSDCEVYYVRGLETTPPLPGIPELEELGIVNREDDTQLFPRSFYWGGGPIVVNDASLGAATDWEIPDPLLSSGGDASWKSFLMTRKEHFFGAEDTPGEAYQELLETHRFGGLTRGVINAY